ncbi:unnamed protein product [Moneuplotes crassus]|uniref:Uncharacterized protein n=1 Tax=Euplotes crassus TaxID=5936 RepID=A0AAD1XPB8_EUPCR|nr:unnamed protein product [Moneuplotes crassus]
MQSTHSSLSRGLRPRTGLRKTKQVQESKGGGRRRKQCRGEGNYIEKNAEGCDMVLVLERRLLDGFEEMSLSEGQKVICENKGSESGESVGDDALQRVSQEDRASGKFLNEKASTIDIDSTKQTTTSDLCKEEEPTVDLSLKRSATEILNNVPKDLIQNEFSISKITVKQTDKDLCLIIPKSMLDKSFFKQTSLEMKMYKHQIRSKKLQKHINHPKITGKNPKIPKIPKIRQRPSLGTLKATLSQEIILQNCQCKDWVMHLQHQELEDTKTHGKKRATKLSQKQRS